LIKTAAGAIPTCAFDVPEKSNTPINTGMYVFIFYVLEFLVLSLHLKDYSSYESPGFLSIYLLCWSSP
jgi:hypothetical protein